MKIGVVGGSGLDNPRFIDNPHEEKVVTPYGEPSSPLTCGEVCGRDVVLLGRHGQAHTIPPSQVNYRANVHALKQAGCTHILATTAVGSLREDIRRGDLVIVDQFIDFTKRRDVTFHEAFEPHSPVHTPMAEPFDETLRRLLTAGCEKLGVRHHTRGTVLTIEGPRFSTRAESRMFRLWGADVINMSIAVEAALANEAGIPYAAVAMSTDYDCWKEDEAPVSWDGIIEVFMANVEKVTQLLLAVIPQIG